MKKTFTFWKSLFLLCALIVGSSSAWGADVVYKTQQYASGDDGTFSKSVSGYSDVSFNNTYNGFTCNYSNFNNYNKGWNYVKCGGSKGAYTGTIITDATIDKAITKVAITIDAITVSKVTSITLYSSSSKTSGWVNVGTFAKSTGTKEVTISSPAENRYYKIEFVCTQGTSNGLVTVSKVEFYTATSDPTITANDVSIPYNATTSGEIAYKLENEVTDGVLSATSTDDWISDISVNTSSEKVFFSASENEGKTNREGTITILYKKDSETLASKVVKVTQGFFELADAKFSVVPGLYNSTQNVALSCSTTGSAIYYTTDGSDPTTESTLYTTGSISVSSTTTIKAVSYKENHYGNIITGTYIIDTNALDFHWKLNTNQTTTATDTEMTWVGTYATMAAAKAGSSTNTNNYYPGTSGQSYTSTRFYKNSTLTITPKDTYIIEGVLFTATNDNYASDFQSSTWTNATAVVSGTSVYVTPTDGRNAISVTLGNTAGFTDVKVFYKQNTATITLASACTDGDFYYGTYSNSSAFVVPDDIIVSEISIDGGKLHVAAYDTGDIVPANTGVMVSSDDAGDHTVFLTTSAGTSVLGNDNMLKPTGDGITADEMEEAAPNCTYYRLTMHNAQITPPGKIGFWWGATGGASFAIAAANKAYLAVPTGVSAKEGFTFEDTTTGINGVEEIAPVAKTRKVVKNGHLVIETANGEFTIDGARVK